MESPPVVDIDVDSFIKDQALLPAFNGKVDMTAAFKWSKYNILDFFDKVTAQPGPRGYNVEAGAQKSLDAVVTAIHTLVNSGTPQTSIFLPNQLDVFYYTTKFRMETIFELVGWIFSVTGFSPPNANRNNYYYPIAALYCVFWRRLTENSTIDPPIKHDPNMVQMTWFKVGSDWRICISSTLDGIGLKPYKDAAQLRRQDVLIASGLLPQSMKNKSLVPTPNPQMFGHCAETIPWLYIKSILKSVSATSAEGFAVKPKLFLPDKYQEAYVYARLDYRVLRPPCENCAYLPPKLGFKAPNFEPPTY